MLLHATDLVPFSMARYFIQGVKDEFQMLVNLLFTKNVSILNLFRVNVSMTALRRNVET